MSETLTHIRGLILDMDGVLWRADTPIGDLSNIFENIGAKGIKVTFATNNATRSAQQYQQKLLRFGVRVDVGQIINSAIATAYYLKRKFPAGGQVFIVGEQGLIETLEKNGFPFGNHDVIAVVAGLDRSINYEKLKQATYIIRSGVPFIATNPDPSYPTPDGLAPGAGSIIAAIETATDVKPVVIGKPKPVMYRIALEYLETAPHETLVVGDRLETDIAGGQELGCKTALVLTGVTTEERALEWSPAPDLIAEDLRSVINQL